MVAKIKEMVKRSESDIVAPRHRLIIKAATSLFAKKGFHKTTVREIARNSGITVGTIYHYVSSKENILSIISEETSRGIDRFVQEADEALLNHSANEALLITIKNYFSTVNEFQELTLFWHHDSAHFPPDQLRELMRADRKAADILKIILDAGCKSGEFKKHDTSLTAQNIIVLGDMWAFRRWVLGKLYTFDEFLEKQIDFILSGIVSGNS